MATKDWKKIGIRSYQKNGMWIGIDNVSNKEFPYIFTTIKEGYIDILGRFKTNSQALKFQKNYMRTH